MDDLLLLLRSLSSLFLHLRLSFFFYSLPALLAPLFLVTGHSPPPCHPRREKEARALFDRVAGSCREHQEPLDGNDGVPPLDRDKGAIKAISPLLGRLVSILFFSASG